jgi:hypothetical protein
MPLLYNKDLMLYMHILLGAAVIALSLLAYFAAKGKDTRLLKIYAGFAALSSWVLLLPSAMTYLVFYPATKTVIKAGAWPWAHSIVMETKEHWGLLLPVITTVAAGLAFTGRQEKSRKWWLLAAGLAIIIGIMGRIIKMGALQ